MHSRRVGDLKVVLVSSLYFGFTNSFMRPSVDLSTSENDDILNTRMLMLPGKGECPDASATSPPAYCSVERRRGSSWLYSTFTVTWRPSLWVSLQRPPTASPGVRGTHTLFTSMSFRLETPRTEGSARKMIPLVSWKNTTHFTPCACQASAVPVWCRSVCTSPCPWGLVAMVPSAFAANLASESLSAGTRFCCMIVICPGAIPKLLCFARSATVCACVSPDVMIARGICFPAPCSCRICWT
mmetsp:Transcript_11771/g.28521  ORF Transcript_11771/g.28521 Transcript_11771/m.28521 type:complete len:241 (-) Transcript_11771:668-1390(-)